MHNYNQLTAHFETINDFLRFGITEASKQNIYYGHGTDNAQDDVYNLIIFSLHLPFDLDSSLLQARLTNDEKKFLAEQLSRRIQERVPVPYLINKAYFCDLPFYVDERVLIPRSPISELISMQFTPWVKPDNVLRILDLCTGSGCIAIACHYAFPLATVDATDISDAALEVAAINCREHQLTQGEVNLYQSDCWEKVPQEKYNIIISNPPYVNDEEMAFLPDEYNHEPTLALRANNNGLAVVDTILAHAAEYLTSDGILIVEVGNSEEAVKAAYSQYPFTWLEFEHGGQGVFLLTAAQLQVS